MHAIVNFNTFDLRRLGAFEEIAVEEHITRSHRGVRTNELPEHRERWLGTDRGHQRTVAVQQE
jgi:hypothetical protein